MQMQYVYIYIEFKANEQNGANDANECEDSRCGSCAGAAPIATTTTTTARKKTGFVPLSRSRSFSLRTIYTTSSDARLLARSVCLQMWFYVYVCETLLFQLVFALVCFSLLFVFSFLLFGVFFAVFFSYFSKNVGLVWFACNNRYAEQNASLTPEWWRSV